MHQKKHNKPWLSPKNTRLIYGAHDLSDLWQSGSYSATPIKIIVHDDWNPHVESFDADIAVLIIDHDVPITNFIKPICLWEDSNPPTVNQGIISGWGRATSLSYHENIPKELKVPIEDLLDCILNNIQLTTMASRRTFCGGFRNGSGPCTGK